MKNHNICETIMIGQSKFCSVSQCPDCNVYHLHMGPISIRLRQDVFNGLCEMLMNIYMEKDVLREYHASDLHSH